MSATAAARSVGQGFGRKARRMVRASSGRSAPRRICGASSGCGAVPTSATRRLPRSARWIRRSAWAMRVDQPGADDQPSSITSSSGPRPGSSACGLSSGRATARISAAASSMRSSSSHHGILAGVCSEGSSPISSRIAGKRTSLGSGGISRSRK
jgi:hypothetical protein